MGVVPAASLVGSLAASLAASPADSLAAVAVFPTPRMAGQHLYPMMRLSALPAWSCSNSRITALTVMLCDIHHGRNCCCHE